MAETEVRVWRLGQDADQRCLVILRDEQERSLPVSIGPCEFYAIWQILDPKSTPHLNSRPQTHDLICSLIERMGARLAKVVIDDLWDDIFFAKLHLQTEGKAVAVDARPSDAIAIALRLNAPLFCEQTVLAAAAETTSPRRDSLDDLLDAADPE